MSFSTSYRPPPPAPSAYFAMQHASNGVSNVLPSPVSTPSTYLPRIPSKLSLHVSQGQTIPINNSQTNSQLQTAPASRNNSASSITALPSLSSSLNNLHAATSIEHLEVVGTRTAEADELVGSLSLPSPITKTTPNDQTATKSNSGQCKTTFKLIYCTPTTKPGRPHVREVF